MKYYKLHHYSRRALLVFTATFLVWMHHVILAEAGPFRELKPSRTAVFDTDKGEARFDQEMVVQESRKAVWRDLCVFHVGALSLDRQVDVTVVGSRRLCILSDGDVVIASGDLDLSGKRGGHGGAGGCGGAGGGGGAGLAIASGGNVVISGALKMSGGRGREASGGGGGGGGGGRLFLASTGGKVVIDGHIDLGGGEGGNDHWNPVSTSEDGGGGNFVIAARDGLAGDFEIHGANRGEFYLPSSEVWTHGWPCYNYKAFAEGLASGSVPEFLAGDERIASPTEAVTGPYSVACASAERFEVVGQDEIRQCCDAALTQTLRHLKKVYELQNGVKLPDLSYAEISNELRHGSLSYLNDGDYIHYSNAVHVANWGLRKIGLPGSFVSRRVGAFGDIEQELRKGSPVIVTYMTHVMGKCSAKTAGLGLALLNIVTFGQGGKLIVEENAVVSDYLHCATILKIESRASGSGFKRFVTIADPWRGILLKRESGHLVEYGEDEFGERFFKYDTAGVFGKSKMLKRFRNLAAEGSILVYQK